MRFSQLHTRGSLSILERFLDLLFRSAGDETYTGSVIHISGTEAGLSLEVPAFPRTKQRLGTLVDLGHAMHIHH